MDDKKTKRRASKTAARDPSNGPNPPLTPPATQPPIAPPLEEAMAIARRRLEEATEESDPGAVLSEGEASRDCMGRGPSPPLGDPCYSQPASPEDRQEWNGSPGRGLAPPGEPIKTMDQLYWRSSVTTYNAPPPTSEWKQKREDTEADEPQP